MSEQRSLPKSSRKFQRVRIAATCTVNVMGSARKYLIEIYDLSLGGMGFLIKSPELAPKTEVQIDFRNLKTVAPFSVRGEVLTQELKVPSPDTTKFRPKGIYRCSLRFEDPVSEKQFLGLISSFNISSLQSKRKAN